MVNIPLLSVSNGDCLGSVPPARRHTPDGILAGKPVLYPARNWT